MSSELRGFLTKAREVLCPTDAIKAFPEAALARLFTFKMGPNDNFMLQAFGPLVLKDAYSSHGATLGAPMEITQAGKELFAPLDTIYDLCNVKDGLADAAQYLLHPSIMDHSQLRKLGSLLKTGWMNRAGRMGVRSLVDLLRVRLAEHATAVRSEADNQSMVLKPLSELDERSEAMYNEANQAAKFKAITMASLAKVVEGRIETVAGATLQLRASNHLRHVSRVTPLIYT